MSQNSSFSFFSNGLLCICKKIEKKERKKNGTHKKWDSEGNVEEDDEERKE